MESELDDKVNRRAGEIIPQKLDPHDKVHRSSLLWLLRKIAKHSDGRLNGEEDFALVKLNDAEKGPSLREKLAKAWDEKKYQSIRDIGRIMVYCGFSVCLTAI